MEWWYLDGKKHREDGPAWIVYYPNGQVQTEQWWLDGQGHREDGPAWIEYSKEGQVEIDTWYLDGQQYTDPQLFRLALRGLR